MSLVRIVSSLSYFAPTYVHIERAPPLMALIVLFTGPWLNRYLVILWQKRAAIIVG